MQIAASYFEMLLALFGGFMMCLATSIHLALLGRVTGFSGILFNIVSFNKAKLHSCLALVSGLILSSGVLWKIFGFKAAFRGVQLFDSPEGTISNLSLFGFALAGYLVGFGTKLGNGCTSGHGVCGLPRLSVRSLVAVLAFMATGIITASVRYHVPFLDKPLTTDLIASQNYDLNVNIVLAAALLLLVAVLATAPNSKERVFAVVSFAVGVLAGVGLVFSGMVRRSKVMNFLTIKELWDPSLMFVMMGAVLGNLFTFNMIIHVQKKPVLADKLEIVTSNVIDWKLCMGASLFGVGWGLGGMCPGPLVLSIPLMLPQICWVAIPALIVGQHSANFMVNTLTNVGKTKHH